MNIRKTALDLLNKYEVNEQYINLSLYSHSLDNISAEERRILTSLLYTTVEHKLTYDYYISAISKRGISEIDPYTRNALRIGFAQIIDINAVPDFAAVNETVKLARNPGERSFLNGILRAAAKSKNDLPLPDKEKNYPRYLSVKYSFPLPTVKLFVKLYGEENAEKLLTYYNTERYTDLSVNTLKISVDEAMERLSALGLSPQRLSLASRSIRVRVPFNVERLPEFKEGELFVQDLASALAVEALSPRANDRVIDTCSCPGGKSFSSAIMMENTGEIYSFDLHESKLSLIEEGRSRLGILNISIDARDATDPKAELFGTADKVICDVPCSGLGVLAKKPDLRYKDISDAGDLYALQLKILESSVKYLKVGGELLYSTCTLNPKENGEIVDKFLADNPCFCKEEFTTGGISSVNGCLTLVPFIHGCDGFFMAKIKRIR